MIVHLNGQLVDRAAARIDPFDRGFLFGEGIYEGLRSVRWAGGSRVVGVRGHIERMQRGLDRARIRFDASRIEAMTAELVAANGMPDAFVYWQVTGGPPGPGEPVRSRVPGKGATPTVFGYCARQPALGELTSPLVRRVVTVEDVRWSLGWLKSVSLMGNVLAAREADGSGCDEAVFVRGGRVAEGLATNVVLALPSAGGGAELVTPSLESAPMLAGVTRKILLALEPSIVERAVMVEELGRASEVMLIGTTTMVAGVVRVDGRTVGDGTPGAETRRLHTGLVGAIGDGLDVGM